MKFQMSKPFYYTLSSLLLLFATMLIFWATKWGIGLSPDSLTYIQGARGILKDADFSGIGAQYPPFYFILLALSGFFAENIILSARYMHILIFVVNAFLFGYLLKSKTQSLWLFLLGLSIFISATSIFKIHLIAWSEPIFITFLLLNFYFITQFSSKSQNRYLILAGVFAALAVLTRYIGIALIITCLYFIVTQPKLQFKERLNNIFLFGLFSSVPFFLWLLRNQQTQNQLTSRSFISHLISFKHIQQGFETANSWFFLSNNKPYFLIVLLVMLSCLSWQFYYKENKNNSADYQLLRVSIIYSFFYIIFLLISISFFDAHTPLDNRILLPVFLCLILIILLIFKKCLEYFRKQGKMVLCFGACIFLLGQIFILEKNLTFFINNGIGYSSKIWATSKTIDYIKHLPRQSIIYSNGPDVINLYLDSSSHMIPALVNPGNGLNNQTFSAQFKKMIADIKSNKGLLVYFININWRWYLPSLQMLAQSLPGFTIYKTDDGFIFSPPQQ